MFRALGAILVGALLIAAANTDIPSPLPWAFGLLPVALLWLARKVGLLLGALAATATLGALYASGIHEPHQLVFIGVLAASGLLLAACSRRGLPASVTASLAAALVLTVAETESASCVNAVNSQPKRTLTPCSVSTIDLSRGSSVYCEIS